MFVIQKVDDHVVEEFCLHVYLNATSPVVLASVDGLGEWFGKEPPSCHVPVGSIEFVHQAMQLCSLLPPKPMNIPAALRTPKFLKREVGFCMDGELGSVADGKDLFLKRADVLKGYVGQLSYGEKLNPGIYMHSEIVDIKGEWRGFVSDGRLIDVVRYGCPYDAPQPDFSLMKEMVAAYKNAPPAWTLDVGVGESGTFVIECHHMYAVGLYGCSSMLIPYMFRSWWNWFSKGA